MVSGSSPPITQITEIVIRKPWLWRSFVTFEAPRFTGALKNAEGFLGNGFYSLNKPPPRLMPAKRSGGCVGNAVAGGWTRRAARARTRSGRAALPEEAGQLRDGGDAAEAARLVGGDVAAGGRGTVRAENTVKPRFRSISYL